MELKIDKEKSYYSTVGMKGFREFLISEQQSQTARQSDIDKKLSTVRNSIQLKKKQKEPNKSEKQKGGTEIGIGEVWKFGVCYLFNKQHTNINLPNCTSFKNQEPICMCPNRTQRVANPEAC